MLNKVRTFKGGFSFGNLNGMPKPSVRHSAIPHQVMIPLQQGFGAEVKPIVKKGDSVKAGQIIAIDDSSMSTPVHATVNGLVEDCEYLINDSEIEEPKKKNSKSQQDESGRRTILIKSDDTTNWQTIDEYVKDIDVETVEGVFKALYVSGVSGLGVSGIPTLDNTSPITPDKVENIIINGTNSEPFSLPFDALLKGNEKAFIIGLNILNFLFPEAGIDLVFDSDQRESYYGVYNALNGNQNYIHKGVYATGKLLDKIFISPLKPKYPQSHQAILTETVVGKIHEPKSNFSAIEYGVLILDASDVFSIYDAVVEKKPLIERTISIGGSAHTVDHGIVVRIGASVKSIVSNRRKSGMEARVVLNSMMTGKTLTNLNIPIDKSTKAIIALHDNSEQEFQSFMRPGLDRGSFSNTFLSSFFKGYPKRADTNLNGEARACIACNYCEYACPVNIYPFLISKYVSHGMADETESLNIFDCIECGLCSYVCPCKIPVLKHIQEGKQKVLEEKDESEAA